MSKIIRRDISPFLQDIRDLLLGRRHKNPLRFEDGLAARDQPPPSVPGGPAHKFSANYYNKRDPRREVAPPVLLADNARKMLTGGGQAAEKKAKLPTPGKHYGFGEHY